MGVLLFLKILVLIALLPLTSRADICDSLRSIDLSGSVVQEVKRNGQTYTGPSEVYHIENSPYSIPGVEFTTARLREEGGEILSKIFVSSRGALFAAREVKTFNSCLLFFVPVNEREWVVPLHVRKVGREFVEVYMEDPNKELLTYRKVLVVF